MSATPELHFGAAQLSRLAVLQQTVAPDDLTRMATHWEAHPLWRYLKQITFSTKPLDGFRRSSGEVKTLHTEFTAAIHERELFVQLFLGAAPFFERDLSENTEITSYERERCEQLCRLVVLARATESVR